MKFVLVILSAVFMFGCDSFGHRSECSHDKEMSCPMMKGVSFKDIKDGDTITSPFKVGFAINGMDVKPAGDKAPNSGHHHLIIDGKAIPKGQVVPKDDKNLHFGKGQTEAELKLALGKHTLTLQFADLNHISYGDEWSKTISVTVK